MYYTMTVAPEGMSKEQALLSLVVAQDAPHVFLQKLGFQTISVDISGEMILKARELDPAGDHRLININKGLEYPVMYQSARQRHRYQRT